MLRQSSFTVRTLHLSLEKESVMGLRTEAHRSSVARFKEGAEIVANEQAPPEYRGRHGIISEVTVGGTEFRVEFDDGLRPTTGYLKSEWVRLS
jgi:hypothetical protein